jgi:hypothetical protein
LTNWLIDFQYVCLLPLIFVLKQDKEWNKIVRRPLGAPKENKWIFRYLTMPVIPWEKVRLWCPRWHDVFMLIIAFFCLTFLYTSKLLNLLVDCRGRRESFYLFLPTTKYHNDTGTLAPLLVMITSCDWIWLLMREQCESYCSMMVGTRRYLQNTHNPENWYTCYAPWYLVPFCRVE